MLEPFSPCPLGTLTASEILAAVGPIREVEWPEVGGADRAFGREGPLAFSGPLLLLVGGSDHPKLTARMIGWLRATGSCSVPVSGLALDSVVVTLLAALVLGAAVAASPHWRRLSAPETEHRNTLTLENAKTPYQLTLSGIRRPEYTAGFLNRCLISAESPKGDADDDSQHAPSGPIMRSRSGNRTRWA